MRLGLVLGDQLSFDLASLASLDPARDAVLMAEVEGEARYVPHHPLKIILIFSAMRHFAQALREDNPELDDESLSHLERIMGASKKMGELIDGLLTLSQFSRGELQRKPVNISHVASRLLEEFASADPQRDVRWEIEPDLNAMADPPLVEALMQNLLNNAWKYTAKTPQAVIRVYAQDVNGQTRFCVSDNGAGFDMARAAGLFQPFRRMHPQAQFEGSGIGLSMVQRIVQHHGGEVRLRSQEGVGTVAEFTLDPPA